MRRSLRVIFGLCAMFTGSAASAAPAAPVDYQREIQPILQKSCYACHGAKKHKGELRLDARAPALKGGDSGPAIVPGKSKDSLLIKLVRGQDPDRVMPAKGDALTPAQIAILSRWIDSGAPWPDDGVKVADKRDWWSLKPIASVRPPAVKDQAWVKNDVDRFILARLEKKKLSPRRMADRRTLIRRVTFDLIGLPPTPAEIDAFVNDPAPDAYEKVVDRLLASPHFGERWARHWLDVARYADSNGFEMNQPRPNAWPYRDWVIAAINSDMPYDEFVREQIGGGSGFRVQGSAKKLEAGSAKRRGKTVPGTVSPSALNTQHSALSTQHSALSPQHSALSPQHSALSSPSALNTQHSALSPLNPEPRTLNPEPSALNTQHSALSSPSALNTQHSALSSLNPSIATGFLVAGPWDQVKGANPELSAQQRADELHDIVSVTTGAFLGLTVGCARCHDHKFDPIAQKDYYRMTAIFAGVNHGDRTLPISPENQVKLAAARRHLNELEAQLVPFIDHDRSKLRPSVAAARNDERFDPVEAKVIRFTITATNTGSEPCIDELEIFSRTSPPQNVALKAGRLASSGNYQGNPNHRLEHINDGRYGNGRSWISDQPGRGWVQIELPRPRVIDHIEWARDREGRFVDRLATKYVIEVAAGTGGPWRVVASSDDRKAFTGGKPQPPRYVANTAARKSELARLLALRDSAEKSVTELSATKTVYAGQFSQPGPTFRLNRGEATSPREQVTPGAIAALSPPLDLPANAPEQQRRAALADWITNPANPLAARVIVNRLWQHHFGRGIVATPSDFGHMGALPTHPELLDYLARQLLRGGWKLKAIHRLIVTSAAYRQSGESDAAARTADSDDTLLWRFPPQRLEAETLRDAILAVSGKLDLTAGGPGFDLFKPNDNYVRVYDPKEIFGPAEFRRMIYAKKPRMQADSIFAAFDCPDAGQTQPRRPVSTTPLQALNLLNSAFMLDQSKYLARRLERQAGPDRAAQVRLAFVLAFGRAPAADESGAALKLIAKYGLPAFCRAIYNTSEFVHVN